MEKGLNTFPGFNDILTILSSLTQESLQRLRCKVEKSNTTCSQQLHAMIMSILRTPGHAQDITRSQNSDHTDLYNSGQTSRVPPQGDLLPQLSTIDYFVVLARMYALLVDEKVCEAELRDRAYREALKACRTSGEEGVAKLQDLRAECLEKCGHHVFLDKPYNQTGTLQSANYLPPGGSSLTSSSEPIPIKGCTINHSLSAPPRSLHSVSMSGTEMPSSCNLQISHSPTVQCASVRNEFHSHVSSCEHTEPWPSDSKSFQLQHSPSQQNVSSLPPEIQQSLNGMHQDCIVRNISLHRETAASSETTNNQDDTFRDSKCSSSLQTHSARLSFPDSPVKCNEQAEGNQAIASAMTGQAEDNISKDKTVSSKTAPSFSLFAQPVNSCSPTVPVQDTCPPSSLVQNNSSESSINKFFSFVILHHPEDEETAIRVCRTLERLGIKDGTTFCEEFSVPGNSPLTCIQDAVDNSAFTVLLLTRLFATRWEDYQTNIVLLNSIEQQHRYNTVIPFLPKDNPLPKTEMPLHLKSLVPLDESSPLFLKKAHNTFSLQTVEKNRAVWINEQKLKTLRTTYQQSQQDKDFAKKWYDTSQKINENCNQIYQYMQPQVFPAWPFRYDFPNFPSIVPPQVPGQARHYPCPPMTLPTQQQFLSHFSPYLPHFLQPYPCVPMNTPYINQGFQASATVTPHAQVFNHMCQPNFWQFQGNPSLSSTNPIPQSSSAPVIQIQNATNVQIGDGNQMRIAENSEEEEEDEAESENGDS